MSWLANSLATIRAAMPTLRKAPSHRPDLAYREHIYSSAATGEGCSFTVSTASVLERSWILSWV